MKTGPLLDCGQRGVHLLFETATISRAFEQGSNFLQDVLERHFEQVNEAIQQLLLLPSAADGRRFISELPLDLQYALVFLYFEALDGRLRQTPVTFH